MIILAFDTCLDKMYVTLSEDGKILSSKITENTETHYHSAFLISTIKNMLKASNLTPDDVNIIATNTGPGSFTGIRACNTVARVFAQAKHIKTIGISSLEILSRLSDNNKVAVILDARKNMAYTAIYEDKKEIVSPQAILLEKVKEIINDRKFDIITDDNLQNITGGVSYQSINADLGKILSEIAYERYVNGNILNWSELKPLYIQPPPVTVKK